MVLPLGHARAQPTELDSLERQLADGLEELSTADCEVACRSLESMTRAADRICELDAGPRCDEARRTVEEAAGRVREACPDCASEGDDDDSTVTRTVDEEEPNMLSEDSAPAPASAPPAENRGAAGCAACSVGDKQRDPLAPLAPLTFFLAAALAAARRRRR